MTKQRDPDRLLDLFLDEGPEVLPDRVLDAVSHDIHVMRQRALRSPWAFLTLRSVLASAAVVVAIAVASGGILWAIYGPIPPGSTNTPPPSPTQLPAPEGVMTPGQAYQPAIFSEPIQFILPLDFGDTEVRGDTWDTHSFRITDDVSSDAITFHDDARLPNDLCNPTASTRDVPVDIGAWLAQNEGVTVSPVTPLTDSTPGPRYWDVELGPSCYASGSAPPGVPAIWFQAGERHRVYAVPVSHPVPGVSGGVEGDTMIVITWGSGFGGEGDEALDRLNPITNILVRSIQQAETPP